MSSRIAVDDPVQWTFGLHPRWWQVLLVFEDTLKQNNPVINSNVCLCAFLCLSHSNIEFDFMKEVILITGVNFSYLDYYWNYQALILMLLLFNLPSHQWHGVDKYFKTSRLITAHYHSSKLCKWSSNIFNQASQWKSWSMHASVLTHTYLNHIRLSSTTDSKDAVPSSIYNWVSQRDSLWRWLRGVRNGCHLQSGFTQQGVSREEGTCVAVRSHPK